MKAKIRKTGEIVDVICFGGSANKRSDVLDYVNYIDSQGVEHIKDNNLNYYWDFESTEIDIDEHWQDIRERAAIAAMQGFLSNPNRIRTIYSKECAETAIRYADALIKQLKEK